MDLCDKYTKLQVRTNADTPHDARVARAFGAKGIGLTRTEHARSSERHTMSFFGLFSPNVSHSEQAFIFEDKKMKAYISIVYLHPTNNL